MQWLTTLPNPRVVCHTADDGQRGWKTHAVDADEKETFGQIRGRRARCGLVPAHGWGLDMFIEDKCARCLSAIERKEGRAKKPVKLYEAWKTVGGETVEEPAEAAYIKSIEAYVIIASSTRKFRIHYVQNQGMNPWKLLENCPVGSVSPIDNWEALDEFTSLKAARRTARKLARESAVR